MLSEQLFQDARPTDGGMTPIWLVVTAGSVDSGADVCLASGADVGGEDAYGDASGPVPRGGVLRDRGAFHGQYPTRKVASCRPVVVVIGSMRSMKFEWRM